MWKSSFRFKDGKHQYSKVKACFYMLQTLNIMFLLRVGCFRDTYSFNAMATIFFGDIYYTMKRNRKTEKVPSYFIPKGKWLSFFEFISFNYVTISVHRNNILIFCLSRFLSLVHLSHLFSSMRCIIWRVLIC